jgi:hypothetical protein
MFTGGASKSAPSIAVAWQADRLSYTWGHDRFLPERSCVDAHIHLNLGQPDFLMQGHLID